MNVSINGYNINYIDEGFGDEILLLHGWGANIDCFANLIALLKGKYRVLALDLPGFGKSDKLKKSFSVDDYVDIVINFLKKLSKEKKIILIGHSYGGRIIIKLNNNNNLPFEIEKNVLIDAAGIKDKKDFNTKAKIAFFKTCKNILNMSPISPEKKKELIEDLRNKIGSKDYISASNELKETLVKAVNEDLSPYIKNMKETLLIWGDKDTATPLWMAKQMEKEIKNVGLVVLNGGHFSFIDDPFTFAKVIASYFKL